MVEIESKMSEIEDKLNGLIGDINGSRKPE
jgi:hypothetical protein